MGNPEVRDEKQGDRNQLSPGSAGFFGALRCHRLDLRYRVAAGKFDIPRLLAFFDGTPEKKYEAVCRTLDPDRLDYHLHFTWETRKDEIILYLGFFAGAIPAREGEREPYAESFMPWLGSFFENATAHGDMHAEFRYPLDQRRSKLFLPIKINIFDDEEAEIRGMSLRFPPKPNGITVARVEHGEKRVNVELNGSTRTDFGSFDLLCEVGALSGFALRLTEERKAL